MDNDKLIVNDKCQNTCDSKVTTSDDDSHISVDEDCKVEMSMAGDKMHNTHDDGQLLSTVQTSKNGKMRLHMENLSPFNKFI